MRLRFGECVFDSEIRELTRKGVACPASPKVLQFLELLLEHRPRAVSKSEIHERLWPRTFVSESSIARLMAEARAALGDDARQPRFLRTVHGFGYAFCGDVVEEHVRRRTGMACGLIVGDREIRLGDGENVLGRSDEATVWINSSKASRQHARIVVSPSQAILEDLGSKNGTYLRGQRIEGRCALTDGDELSIGEIVMTFRSAGGPRTTETADH